MTTIIQQIQDEFERLKVDIQKMIENTIVTSKQVRTATLADISPILGLIQSFEFRTPGDPNSATYSGIQITENGIATYKNGSQTGSIQNDGDAFFGSNIASPTTTSFQIFSQAQTYNGESMGAGDILFGDNSTGQANMFWDASAKKLQFRSGTIVYNEMSSGGSLRPYGCRVGRNTPFLSVSNTTETSMQFNFTMFDDAGFVNLVSDNTKVTIPTGYGGRYHVGGWAYFAPNATGYRLLNIKKNGLATAGNFLPASMPGFSTEAAMFFISDYMDLSAGDYLQARVYQNSGGALDVSAEISILKVG